LEPFWTLGEVAALRWLFFLVFSRGRG
jgi:hypothetical protein